MKLGIIADDFTGASDIALTLAEGGMRCVQYVGIPTDPAATDIDAGIVSLKSRTIAAKSAVEQSLAACDWLLAQGCRQIVFKVCSTFDSTIEGNIGPVAAALAARLGETQVFVCPALPENGRSVYQGHLFVNDKLLNECGMQDHPLTPMTDPDLRRVLAAQTDWDVAHMPLAQVTAGADAISANLPDTPAMIIVDAVDNNDLRTIALAAGDRKLLVGGSGIALGLPANFDVTDSVPHWGAINGPGAILSGSCSIATRAQVAAYAQMAPARDISPEAIMEGDLDVEGIATWVLQQDRPALIYSSADPTTVKSAQDRFGRAALADAIDGFFTDLTSALVRNGLARLVVAGGETSGAVVAGLGVSAFEVGPRVAAGVPLLRPTERTLALALKSGNFGGPHFFAEALHRMSVE